MSNSGVQIIHWLNFLFTLHSPLPDSVSAPPPPPSAKPILVIWHWRVSGGYSAVIIKLLDIQCVARKHCVTILQGNC